MNEFFSNFDFNKKPLLIYHKGDNYIKNSLFGFIYLLAIIFLVSYYIIVNILKKSVSEYTFSQTSCDSRCEENLKNQPFFDFTTMENNTAVNVAYQINLKSFLTEESMAQFFKYFRLTYTFPKDNKLSKYILDFKCNQTDISPDAQEPKFDFNSNGTFCSADLPINKRELNFFLNESSRLTKDISVGFESCASIKYKNDSANFVDNKIPFSQYEQVYNNQQMQGCNYNTEELFRLYRFDKNMSIVDELFQISFTLPGKYRFMYMYQKLDKERYLFNLINMYRVNFKITNDSKQMKYFIANKRQQIDYPERFLLNYNSFLVNFFDDNLLSMNQDIRLGKGIFLGPALKVHLFHKTNYEQIVLNDSMRIIELLSKIGGLLSIFRNIYILFDILYPFYFQKFFAESLLKAQEKFSNKVFNIGGEDSNMGGNNAINSSESDFLEKRSEQSCQVINVSHSLNDKLLKGEYNLPSNFNFDHNSNNNIIKECSSEKCNNKNIPHLQPPRRMLPSHQNLKSLSTEIKDYLYNYSIMDFLKDKTLCRFKERSFMKTVKNKFSLDYYFYNNFRIQYMYEYLFHTNPQDKNISNEIE